MAKPLRAALLVSALGWGFWNKAHGKGERLAGAGTQPGNQPSAAPANRGAGARDGEAHDAGRGRTAARPSDIPARGWKDVLIRTAKEFSDDQIPMISAGITFYCLLALFPAIGAFVGLYGLFADPSDVGKHLASLSLILPGGALTLIGDQLKAIATADKGGLSLAFIAGLLTSIWSANGAVKAMMTGLNIAYDEKDTRKFIRKTLISLAFTLGFLVFVILAVALLAARPVVEAYAGRAAGMTVAVVSWPILLVMIGLGLALLYRFGPSRDQPRWRWITPGGAGALAGWVIVSVGFSLYAANFGHFNKTYGSLGAAIGFMTWTWLSSMVILFGAELNSELEHQTAKDTTVGAPQPMGERDASMADTLGKAQGR